MFIQKDLRKVPRILSDAVKASEPPSFEEGHESSKEPEKLTELRLARRAPEFGGNLSILCQPRNAPALHHLTTLSLYDCQIRSLDGIGMLGSPASDGNSTICCPNLRELNIGRNPISTLPDELALLAHSLTTLWCDDCQITGTIPNCVMKLSMLETLRMSNNAITHIPEEIENLSALRVLALDGNQLEMVPRQLSKLSKLSSLILR
jgi:Leucine-rich repeat (LRR) protein